MSTFKLRPAYYSDIPHIARVFSETFQDDVSLGNLMHPHRNEYRAGMELWFLRGTRVSFWDYRGTWLVVVLEIDHKEIVDGCAHWCRMGNGGKDRDLWWIDPCRRTSAFLHIIQKLTSTRLGNLLLPLSSEAMKVHSLIWPNRACNPKQLDVIERSLPFVSHLWSGERTECWNLEALGVHPSYQSRSIGRLLAGWGLKRAEQVRVYASVTVAPGKDRFYQQGGSEILDGIFGEDEGNSLAHCDGN